MFFGGSRQRSRTGGTTTSVHIIKQINGLVKNTYLALFANNFHFSGFSKPKMRFL